jgi:hypothetical protein
VGRRARPWISACCALLLLAGRAAAQPSPCGDLDGSANDELEVTPPDRAQGVARNASVVVRHPPGADLSALLRELQAGGGDECSREPVCLFEDARERGGSERQAVPGDVQQLDARTLAFVPRSRLLPETDYFPLVARTGFDSASRTELEFRTGTGSDREPPTFDPGEDQLRLAVDTPPEECQASDGSVRVQLGTPRAQDDGDEESVELLLFVTSAEGVRGPELRARSRNGDEDDGEVVLTFLLSAREAEQPVCVALRAVDAVGRASRGEPALCFEPSQGSHFEPLCGVAPGHGSADGGRGTLLLSCVGFLLALRRRRSRPNMDARQ